MIDREAERIDTQTYAYAERRIELCAFEVRRRERQWSAFYEEQHRVRVVNSSNDGASVAVFHGERQMTRRERMLAEHRQEVEQERRNVERRHALALRRVSVKAGVLHFCRHCNVEMWRGVPGNKCRSCKADPDLVTARGTETRSNEPRREAQPNVTPLSVGAEIVLAIIADLAAWMREPIELRYFERLTDLAAAERLGVRVPAFVGYARAGVMRVACLLANPSFAP